MEYATMSRSHMDRKAMFEMGAIEVPWGSFLTLHWDDISKDCLPVIVYKSSTPKAIICANRLQLDSVRQENETHVRECYIVEIARIMKHSNLTYCEDNIERDRKFRHKKKKILSNTKKLMMKDIVQNLNRTRTAAEIAATYGTNAFNVNILAGKLRQAPYNFNIPGARGFDEFAVFAAEIAQENPGLVRQPLASKKPPITIPPTKKVLLSNGHGR